jgi:hypothetical protein
LTYNHRQSSLYSVRPFHSAFSGQKRPFPMDTARWLPTTLGRNFGLAGDIVNILKTKRVNKYISAVEDLELGLLIPSLPLPTARVPTPDLVCPSRRLC